MLWALVLTVLLIAHVTAIITPITDSCDQSAVAVGALKLALLADTLRTGAGRLI